MKFWNVLKNAEIAVIVGILAVASAAVAMPLEQSQHRLAVLERENSRLKAENELRDRELAELRSSICRSNPYAFICK